MKFKVSGDVERPEKSGEDRYINVRSCKRIDVRPGETLDVDTCIQFTPGKKSTVVELFYGQEYEYSGNSYKDLKVRITNNGPKTIMIYPGQVIAYILEGEKEYKSATLSSSATLVDNTPGFHAKKPCSRC